MTTRPRDAARAAYRDFIDSGRMPIMELPTSKGICTIDVFVSAYGIGFNWGVEDASEYDTGSGEVWFDGCLRPRGDAYYMSWAEIDRNSYKLDDVLTIIHDNVLEGLIIPHGLTVDS